MERRVFYLCNGEKEDCKKRTCYKNGGECKHTSNVEYALNFERPRKNCAFFEKEGTSRNETPSEN